MPEKSKVTRDDVAKLAGVAPSTVSSVVNNKGNVSDKLTQKVLDAIKKLNYTPNLVARSLRTQTTKHLGLIIDEISNPHFSEMTKGCQYEARQNGYILSISLADKYIDETIEDFISRNVDGMIFNTYSNMMSHNMRYKLEFYGIPYVECGGFRGISKYTIRINYFNGMKKIYKYLNEMGHRKIAFISGMDTNVKYGTFDEPRTAGFQWCCESFGNGFDERYLIAGEPPYNTLKDDGYVHCMKMLDRNLEHTAVIVGNDYMAIGVLKALRERGIRVPEDISVASFDNSIYAEACYPTITSLGVPAFDVGQNAVRLLFKIREKGIKNVDSVDECMEPVLVIRQSVKEIRDIR